MSGAVVSGSVLPHVVYAGLADLVLAVHLAFILFVASGAFVAWRWPRVGWAHILAVAYAAAIVTVGFDCPLTGLEKHLRRLASGSVYDGGFVNHYLTDVIYPGRLLGLLRWLIVVGIVMGYSGSYLRWRRANSSRCRVLGSSGGRGTRFLVTMRPNSAASRKPGPSPTS
jgi:hypothetical protein